MKITFNKLNRRTHLYLGLGLTPWFLLYALSSVVLNHGSWFDGAADRRPEWIRRFEHAYRLPPLGDAPDQAALAEKILADHGLTGRYRSHFDDDDNLVVLRTGLVSTIRLTYYPDQGRIVAEERRFRLAEALTAAHFRAGYTYPYAVEILWAVMIDLVVVSTLLWILTGLYLWWKLKGLRSWGWVALGAGLASFVFMVVML